MPRISRSDLVITAVGILGVFVLVGLGAAFGVTVAAVTMLLPLAVMCTIRFPIVGWLLWVLGTSCNGATVTALGLVLQPELIAFPFLCLAIYRERTRAAQKYNDRGPVPLGLLSTALILWLVVNLCSSLLVAPAPASSLRILALMSVSVATFFVLVQLPRSRVAAYVRAGAILMAVVALVTIAAWLTAQVTAASNPLVVKNYGESVFRTKWLMIEPNLLASLLVLWLAVVVVYKRAFKSGLLLVTMSLLAACAFLSFTRAAWVGLIVLALVLLLSGRTAPIKILLAGVVGVVVVGYFGSDLLTSGQGLGQTFSDRVTGIVDLKSGTGAYRARAWLEALNDVRSLGHIFGGLGTNSFSQRHGAVDSTTGQAYLGNFWIVLLYDSGLAGVVAIVVAGAVVLRRTFRWITSPFYVSLFLAAFATNPMWFGYPWALMAILWVAAPRTTAPESTTQPEIASVG
jgi:hypothetical protein